MSEYESLVCPRLRWASHREIILAIPKSCVGQGMLKDFIKKLHAQMGASTVKWTTPEPWVGLSESDSKLYTNFELSKEKS